MALPQSEEEKPPERPPEAGALAPPVLFRPKFVLVLALQFAFGLGFSSFLLLPKYLATVHGAGADQIGRLMAAGPIAAVAMLPIIAPRIDRWSRGWLMAGAAFAMLVGSLGFAWLSHLGPLAYVLRALHGAAFTVYMSAAATLTVDLAPRERVGQAVGLVGAANLATNAVAPAFAEPLAAAHGWQPVFVLSAICSFFAAAGALWLREQRDPVQRSSSSAPLFAPRFLKLIYAGMIVGIAFGTVLTFYQPLALSLGIKEVSDWFVGYTVAALGVRTLGGAFLDRFDRKRLSLLSAALYSTAVLLTAALQPGWLFALGLLLGLAHGAMWPALTALCVEGSTARTRGALLTYFGGSFNVGVAVSTLGFGALAHALGYRPVIFIAGLLAATSCVVLTRLGHVATEPDSVRYAR